MPQPQTTKQRWLQYSQPFQHYTILLGGGMVFWVLCNAKTGLYTQEWKCNFGLSQKLSQFQT